MEINYFSIIITTINLFISLRRDNMANNKGIFPDVLRLLFLCIVIEQIVQLHVSARVAIAKDETASDMIPSPKKGKSKVFEPLQTKFPDTKRTGAKAEKYKEELLKGLHGRAQKEDKNLKMTGESCARGLGALYKV